MVAAVAEQARCLYILCMCFSFKCRMRISLQFCPATMQVLIFLTFPQTECPVHSHTLDFPHLRTILVTCTVLISHMIPLIWNLVTAPAQLLAILRLRKCWLSCACAIVGYPKPAQLLAILRLRNCWLSCACAIVGYPAPAQLLAILRLRKCWLSCACA